MQPNTKNRTYSVTNREQFLALRRADIARVRQSYGEHAIICDPGDEIICDHCNDEIVEQLVHVDMVASYATCPKCRGEYAAH